LRLPWGYWESKVQDDNLDKEIQKKFAKGYPNDNILFEDSQTAVLIQGGQEVQRVSIFDANWMPCSPILSIMNAPSLRIFGKRLNTLKHIYL
jgi:hypothetical protein